MNTISHSKLIIEVKKLKELTSTLKIEDIVNFICVEQKKFNEGKKNGERLSSPLKQGMYLLAIACSQNEPSNFSALDNSIYNILIKTLNAIFNQYALAYFPSEAEISEGLDDQWKKHRQIAMPAFLNYFTAGFKASTDQIKEWICYYYLGFESDIINKFGIDHKTMIEIGDFIENKILDNFNRLFSIIKEIDDFRQQSMLEMKKDYDSAIKSIRSNERFQSLGAEFYALSNEVYSVNLTNIEKEFGSTAANSILQFFTTIRGDSTEITYITDANPVVKKPLISLNDGKFYFLLNNSFYQAIIENIEKELTIAKNSHSFLKARDNRLEEKTCDLFKKILPDNAVFYPSVFEQSNSHNEHDLVIIHENNLLIIEAKASPPREPLRDPAKAFIRINDHFRSNAGIQKAYEQAHSLENKFMTNATVDLFDQKGRKLVTLNSSDFENIYCICITRDDFGALATDLSLLLKKPDEAKYPWVINITDLASLIDGFIHLDLNVVDFYKYLTQRQKLHGKVLGIDELEYAGAFLKYNGLDSFINAKADFIPLDISESDIFDKIYMAKLNGEKYTFSPQKPVITSINRNDIFNRKPNNQNKATNKKNRRRALAKKSKKINRKN